MTNALTQSVVDFWQQGRRTKSTQGGWISANAVCCADKRGRGGLIVADNAWIWHCFNCGFKTGWKPGNPLTEKNKKIIKLFGASDDQVSQLTLLAMRLRYDLPVEDKQLETVKSFPYSPLPESSMPMVQALQAYADDTDLLAVCEYVIGRNLDLEKYYWDPDMPTRFILPYTWHGMNVGWTARSINNARPKYLSHTPNGYVYGLDQQHESWTQLIACEGVLDAQQIGGVAVLGNNISETQREHIERLKRNVIWVADQDETGLKLTERIVEWGWAVSIPNWPGCKDINDAVVQYGRAATLLSIITTATHNRVAATLRIKQLRHKLKYERTN